MKTRPGRRFVIWLGIVVAVGAFMRLGWIGSQAPTGDDANVAWTAVNYVLTGQPNPILPYHPVLRNLLVFVSGSLFGGTVAGVKAWSLLFGILLVGVVGMFVRRAARDERAGLFAAGLVAMDIVQIDYSRQAIQEIHAAFFAVLGAWLVVEALRAEDTRPWRWLLPLAGLSFGLGVASKFYVIPPLVLSIALVAHALWKRRRVDEAVLAGASLVPLPFLVYLLTYVPWFKRGYSLPEWVRYQAAAIQAMITHTKPADGWMAFNRPALWFLQPFYGEMDVAIAAAGAQVTIAVGNPLVWLAVLPAVAYSLLTPAQRRRDVLLLLFFLASYAPLALSPRPIWMLSSVAVFPFAAAVVASVAAGLSRRPARRLVWLYGTAVLVTSLLLYPLAIGRALEFPHLQPIVRLMGDVSAEMNGP